jgi:hypothetical protein
MPQSSVFRQTLAIEETRSRIASSRISAEAAKCDKRSEIKATDNFFIERL